MKTMGMALEQNKDKEKKLMKYIATAAPWFQIKLIEGDESKLTTKKYLFFSRQNDKGSRTWVTKNYIWIERTGN